MCVLSKMRFFKKFLRCNFFGTPVLLMAGLRQRGSYVMSWDVHIFRNWNMDFHPCSSYVIPFSRSLMLLHLTAMHLTGIFYRHTSLLGLFNSRRLLNFKFNEKISHWSPRKWMSNFTRTVITQVKFWKFHVWDVVL